MSTVRPGTCAEPGPYDWHCTEHPMHRYSCYDAGEDASFTHRTDEWPAPHNCTDPHCSEGQQP